MRKSISCIALLSATVQLSACGRTSNGPHPQIDAKSPSTRAALDSEPVTHDDTIVYELSIYFLPAPNGDPIARLRNLLGAEGASFREVEEFDEEIKEPAVVARLATDLNKYQPPNEESLRYSGRGLTREEAARLQEAEQALILDFAYPSENVWSGLRASSRLIHQLAVEYGGLIWDEATREVFTPEAWEERRLKDWTAEIPDISRHITIHAYKNGDYMRAISLGMEKAGLPDVVVEDFPWSVSRNIGHTINLFTQAMAEGAAVRLPGAFNLDIRRIRSPEVRNPQLASLKENATGIALLTLKPGERDEGDPFNNLIELTFDRGEGPDVQSKQENVIGKAFGWEDETIAVEHDQAIMAASRQARAQLPQLKAAFSEGLSPGEFVQVKAPFDVPEGGHEWMWVEITAWEDEQIRGVLRNEPFYIPELHAGQVVDISEATVFDYIWQKADGTSQGNETGKLIERQTQ